MTNTPALEAQFALASLHAALTRHKLANKRIDSLVDTIRAALQPASGEPTPYQLENLNKLADRLSTHEDGMTGKELLSNVMNIMDVPYFGRPASSEPVTIDDINRHFRHQVTALSIEGDVLRSALKALLEACEQADGEGDLTGHVTGDIMQAARFAIEGKLSDGTTIAPQPAPDEKPVAWLSVTTGKGPYDKGHIQSVSLEKPDYPSAMFEALPLYAHPQPHPQPQSDVGKALELAEGRLALLMRYSLPDCDHETATPYIHQKVVDALKALRTAGGEHE